MLARRGRLQGIALAVEGESFLGEFFPGNEIHDSETVQGLTEGGHQDFNPGFGQSLDAQDHGIPDDRAIRSEFHADLDWSRDRGCFQPVGSAGHQGARGEERCA